MNYLKKRFKEELVSFLEDSVIWKFAFTIVFFLVMFGVVVVPLILFVYYVGIIIAP